MSTTSLDAIVIGGGHNGLTAAAYRNHGWTAMGAWLGTGIKRRRTR